jgi:uncharacterized membrane protein
MEPWRLFAHRHWISLRILGRELRLCARCSGYALGLLALTAYRAVFGLRIFDSLGTPLQFLLCYLTVVPLACDWLTQSWGWRESNNRLRLLTGTIIGVGLSLFSQVAAPSSLKALCLVYTATAITAAGLIKGLGYRFFPRPQEL